MISPAPARVFSVDVATDGQGLSTYFEGQVDTLGQWGHIVCLRKGSGSATQHIVRAIAGELVSSDTNSPAHLEIGELYLHDLATMEAANPGVDWNLP